MIEYMEDKDMTNIPPWATFGSLIALLVLLVSIVFTITGRLDTVEGALFAALALARLVP